MPAEINKERLIPTSYSAAILAETNSGPDLQTAQVLLVRDRETKKWGLPAGHAIIMPDERLELPFQTVIREWDEETGGLPMDFIRTATLENVLLIHDSKQNRASPGFIFKATFKDDFPEKNFRENPKNILTFQTRAIKNSFEKDRVGLFNYHQIMRILTTWRTSLYRPTINGDPLLEWCNSLVGTYADLYFPGTDWTVPREKLGFTWNSITVDWPRE